jgi:ABC-type glycerol-3-phosphate transport system substrate-binding protein
MVMPGKDHRYMWYLFAGPLYSMGGSFLDDEGNFDVNSSEYREMFTYMVNLVKEGAAPTETLGWSWTDAPETFARGKAAMLLAGSVNATRWEDSPPDAIKGDWDFVPPLAWEEGGPGITTIDGTAYWAVNKYATEAEKAASMLFLDFYRSYQSQWNEIGYEGNECGVTAMYEMDSIKNAVYKPDVRRTAIKNTGGESLPINGDQMIKYELEWWAKAATGEVSTEEALERLAEDIEGISP